MKHICYIDPNVGEVGAGPAGPQARQNETARTGGVTRMDPAVAPTTTRDVLSPREVATRAGFSYHAILRAIRRGDLQAFEPVPGHYRVGLDEYERWLHTPARRRAARGIDRPPSRRRTRPRNDDSDPGSFARLEAIEGAA